MTYLTYNEYVSLGFTEIEGREFSLLVKKASSVLDSVTRYFYKHNDLETDINLRKSQFKKALAAQIEYFYEVGGTTIYSVNEPRSITIGRTSMSQGAKGSTSGNESKANIVSDDVYLYLKGTGLLYCGMGVL